MSKKVDFLTSRDMSCLTDHLSLTQSHYWNTALLITEFRTSSKGTSQCDSAFKISCYLCVQQATLMVQAGAWRWGQYHRRDFQSRSSSPGLASQPSHLSTHVQLYSVPFIVIKLASGSLKSRSRGGYFLSCTIPLRISFCICKLKISSWLL